MARWRNAGDQGGVAGVGNRREIACNASGIASFLEKAAQVGDFQPALFGFEHVAGAKAVDRDEQDRLFGPNGDGRRTAKQCDARDQGLYGRKAAYHQKPAFRVTKTWRGAAASRVWLSPLKPKPFEPIVET